MYRFLRLLPLLLAPAVFADDLYPVEERLWSPAADSVYRQELGRRAVTEAPVTSVAVLDDAAYAVVDGSLHRLSGDALAPVVEAPEGIRRIEALQDALWIAAEDGLHRYDGATFAAVDGRAYIDFCIHRGAVHGATVADVFRYEDGRMVPVKPEGGYWSARSNNIMEDGTQVLPDPVEWGRLTGITSYSDTLHGLIEGGMAVLEGRKVNKGFIDFGGLPSANTRAIERVGSRVLIATDRGLAVMRGNALSTVAGADGLPIEDITCIAPGAGTDVWLGTAQGAIRYTGDAFHYFGHDLWLPGPMVHDIAYANDTAYIATDGGLATIRYIPMTLMDKAAYYEARIHELGHKRLGFVSTLRWDAGHDEWIRVVSDNDGGLTGDYLAAMSYKYAVTGDPKARDEALDAFEALVWLDEVGPKPGFIARAIWGPGDKDEREQRGSGGLPADWYETDDGWWWKGDTSSDEVAGHFYAVSLFHDLAAKGKEKDRAAVHLGRIAKHIVDNGWVLSDMDDKPTRWGRWDPKYLKDPYGITTLGLNGFQAQAFMIVAGALTGDPIFDDALQQLVDWGYPDYTWGQKLAFPPNDIVSHDDRLALMCYHPVFRYVEDPELRAVYLRSIERTWAMKRIEHMAWWNFSYGAITGNDCDVEESVQYLREWPLDCRGRSFTNSMRRDLAPEPGYPALYGLTRAPSPREMGVVRGSRNHLRIDVNQGTPILTEPAAWLMDYWMGRYHGFITEAADRVDALPPDLFDDEGAAPYDGPPRPAIDYDASL